MEVAPSSNTDREYLFRASMGKYFNHANTDDDEERGSDKISSSFVSQPGPKSTFFPHLPRAESAEMFTSRGRGRDTANPTDLLRVAPGRVYTAQKVRRVS